MTLAESARVRLGCLTRVPGKSCREVTKASLLSTVTIKVIAQGKHTIYLQHAWGHGQREPCGTQEEGAQDKHTTYSYVHGVMGWTSRVVPTSVQEGPSLETLIPQDGITQARHEAEDRAIARE